VLVSDYFRNLLQENPILAVVRVLMFLANRPWRLTFFFQLRIFLELKGLELTCVSLVGWLVLEVQGLLNVRGLWLHVLFDKLETLLHLPRKLEVVHDLLVVL